MEGLGLILAFTSIWLWYSRKECRFPQVFLLIPLGLACIWTLNVVRLCALFFIGDSGRPEIAEAHASGAGLATPSPSATRTKPVMAIGAPTVFSASFNACATDLAGSWTNGWSTRQTSL